MKTWRIGTGLILLLIVGVVHAQGLMISRYVEGEHYLAAKQPIAPPDDGKIHVTEFFLYSCPHCYHLESDLNRVLSPTQLRRRHQMHPDLRRAGPPSPIPTSALWRLSRHQISGNADRRRSFISAESNAKVLPIEI